MNSIDDEGDASGQQDEGNYFIHVINDCTIFAYSDMRQTAT